jgi:hypothetical protein
MADAAKSSFPYWRAAAFGVGLTSLLTGVALMESGIDAGRILLTVGLPIAAVSLIALAVPRRPPPAPPLETAERRLSAVLARVGTHIGLEIEVDRISGRYKERQVEATIDPPDGPIRARALVVRPLDLGLTAQRGRPPGDARPAVRVGNEEFDTAYCVLCDEPERAPQIFTERMRELLMSVDAQLDDSGVRVIAPGCEAHGLHDALRFAVKLTYELDRASNRARCAEPLVEAREAWLAFAQEHKLASADTPLAIWGQMGRIAVSAISVRDSFQHFHFEVTASFATPLGRGLELKPASSAKQFDRSGDPIGHPAFDKVFVLKARDPQDAPRLLGPESRNALLALRDTGLQLRGNDTGLWAWVGLNRAEPHRVPQGLTRMAQIAERIMHNAERFPPNF